MLRQHHEIMCTALVAVELFDHSHLEQLRRGATCVYQYYLSVSLLDGVDSLEVLSAEGALEQDDEATSFTFVHCLNDLAIQISVDHAR